MKLPFTEYIEAAMRRASYDKLDEKRFYGEIADCPGVYATGLSLVECQDELRSVLEGWILVSIKSGGTLPVIDGINLNEVPELEPADSL